MNRLPGTVRAPVRRQEHIHRPGRLAACHAPVRQIKLGILQRQERQIIRPRLGHHQRRRRPRRSPRQPGIKMRQPLIVGHSRAQNLVGLRQQFHRNPGPRPAIPEAPQDHIQPVHAQERRHPQIRHREPLPRGREIIRIQPRHRRLQCEDPRRLALQRLRQVQPRRDIAVHLLHHCRLAGPDLRADLAAEVILGIVINRLAEIPVLNGAQHVAVGDTVQRQVQRLGVHRLHRQPRLANPGQHITAPRKPHPRGPVPDILGNRHRLRQALAIARRQALAEGHSIARTVAYAFHAQAAVAIQRHRQPGLGQLHETGIIHRRIQRLREGGADRRPRRIGLHIIAANTESVFRNRIIQRRSRVIARLQILRQPQRLHLVPSPAHCFQRGPHGDQNIVPLGLAARPQKSVHRRIDRALPQGGGVVRIAVRRRQQQPRIFCPVGRGIRNHHSRSGKPVSAAIIA